MPGETASVTDKEQPHSKAADTGPCRAQAMTTQLPAETEEPNGGIGESNLITSLIGLCKSKVLAAKTVCCGVQGGGELPRGDLGAQLHVPEVVPLSPRKVGWP